MRLLKFIAIPLLIGGALQIQSNLIPTDGGYGLKEGGSTITFKSGEGGQGYREGGGGAPQICEGGHTAPDGGSQILPDGGHTLNFEEGGYGYCEGGHGLA